MPGSQMHPHTSSFHIGLLPLQHGSVFFVNTTGAGRCPNSACAALFPCLGFRFAVSSVSVILPDALSSSPAPLYRGSAGSGPSFSFVLLHHPRLLAGASDSLAGITRTSSFARSPFGSRSRSRAVSTSSAGAGAHRITSLPHPVELFCALPRRAPLTLSTPTPHPRPIGCIIVVACSRR
jgi:hypothetical protein